MTDLKLTNNNPVMQATTAQIIEEFAHKENAPLPPSLKEWVLQNLEDHLEDIAKYGAYDHLDDSQLRALCNSAYEKEMWEILQKSCKRLEMTELEVLRAFCDKDAFLSGLYNDRSSSQLRSFLTVLVCYAVEKLVVEHQYKASAAEAEAFDYLKQEHTDSEPHEEPDWEEMAEHRSREYAAALQEAEGIAREEALLLRQAPMFFQDSSATDQSGPGILEDAEWDMEAEDLARERYQAFLENQLFDETTQIIKAVKCGKAFLRSPIERRKCSGGVIRVIVVTPLFLACVDYAIDYATAEFQKGRECCHETYHSIKCWHTWDQRLTDFICSQIWEHLADTGCITPLLKSSGTDTIFYKLVFQGLWPNIQHFLAKRRANILQFL